ncbi:hypothetical protein NPIL_129291 [Nephila pilipes]|uniref:Uncharacterized protein n=1 Tax=Nephila pilipes TaxID=299642 RepID=A0A8X6NB14_NEPPI|nr:hypothetical protein NPIL_129291 [Nephila pilipes]
MLGGFPVLSDLVIITEVGGTSENSPPIPDGDRRSYSRRREDRACRVVIDVFTNRDEIVVSSRGSKSFPLDIVWDGTEGVGYVYPTSKGFRLEAVSIFQMLGNDKIVLEHTIKGHESLLVAG